MQARTVTIVGLGRTGVLTLRVAFGLLMAGAGLSIAGCRFSRSAADFSC